MVRRCKKCGMVSALSFHRPDCPSLKKASWTRRKEKDK